MNFKYLKRLYLNNNNISDIKILEKVRFPHLVILDLHGNKIDIKKYISVIEALKNRYYFLDY